MSQATSNRNLAAVQADEGSVPAHSHDRTRLQSQTNEDEQKQHAHPFPVHGSPAMRLYRHAQESILGMLTLEDLSRALAVSREWSAAVCSMKPIHAVLERDLRRSTRERPLRQFPPMARLVSSPLLRHLSAIQLWDPRAIGGPLTCLNLASLGLLAQHAPNLTSLWCTLILTPNEPLLLPAKLKSLQLQLNGKYRDAATNGVLTALAAIPSLSHLRLELDAFDRENAVDLRILAACPSLSNLALDTVDAVSPDFTPAQLEHIRTDLGHLRSFSVGRMDSVHLARLLQPPVTARWADIGQVWAGEGTGALLLGLPTLTTADLRFVENIPHADFLAHLPLLTTLRMQCDISDWDERQTWSVPADALLASLVRCSGLTDLSVECAFHSAHWAALLAKLTRLRKLTIHRGDLTSLECFKAGAITQSLEELAIEELDLPPSEVSYLYGLSRLRTLRVDGCFYPSLDDATIDSVSPPTPILPALTSLWYHRTLANGPWGTVERTGRSYEWMQQR